MRHGLTEACTALAVVGAKCGHLQAAGLPQARVSRTRCSLADCPTGLVGPTAPAHTLPVPTASANRERVSRSRRV